MELFHSHEGLGYFMVGERLTILSLRSTMLTSYFYDQKSLIINTDVCQIRQVIS